MRMVMQSPMPEANSSTLALKDCTVRGIVHADVWRGYSADACAGHRRKIVECGEGATKLVDVFGSIFGAEIFKPAGNQYCECRKAGAEVGLSDDGGRKI